MARDRMHRLRHRPPALRWAAVLVLPMLPAIGIAARQVMPAVEQGRIAARTLSSPSIGTAGVHGGPIVHPGAAEIVWVPAVFAVCLLTITSWAWWRGRPGMGLAAFVLALPDLGIVLASALDLFAQAYTCLGTPRHPCPSSLGSMRESVDWALGLLGVAAVLGTLSAALAVRVVLTDRE